MSHDDRSAPSPTPCPEEGYGARAKTRERICSFATQIEEIIDTRERSEIPGAVAEAMKPLLADPGLLDDDHCLCQPETYRRHVLYADPKKRFTILALVWRPGHVTPVHGHRAWGAVGVYEGRPNVALFDCPQDEAGERRPVLKSDVACGPGDVTHVHAGYDDVHKIYNATEERIITIHVYGRDLVQEPESINLLVAAS